MLRQLIILQSTHYLNLYLPSSHTGIKTGDGEVIIEHPSYLIISLHLVREFTTQCSSSKYFHFSTLTSHYLFDYQLFVPCMVSNILVLLNHNNFSIMTLTGLLDGDG